MVQCFSATFICHISTKAKGSGNIKAFVLVIVLLLEILLSTVCAWVAFTIELSELKSEMASFRMASSIQQQPPGLLEKMDRLGLKEQLDLRD